MSRTMDISVAIVHSVIKKYKLYQTNQTLSRKLVLQNSEEGELWKVNSGFEEATEFNNQE